MTGRYTVVWKDDIYDGFPSFERAERFARKRVAEVDARGFSESAEILEGMKTVATVRMDGCGRVWTDISIYSELPV